MLLVSLFISSRAPGCFHPLAAVNDAAEIVGALIPGGVPAFDDFQHVPSGATAGSYGESRLRFLSRCPAVPDSDCAVQAPTAAHGPHRRSLSSGFLASPLRG